MDEKTAKKNHFFDITYITLTIIITGLGVLVFAVILMFLSGERAKSITFNRGWQVEYHGETFSNVDLNSFSFEDLKKADTIVIENTLPGNLPEDSCMMVHVHYHDILVELDGEEILAMDRDRYDRDEMLGSGFYIARIGSDGEGKNVRIVMRAGEDGALTSIETPSIWDYDTFYRDYASENVYKIALAFFFMVVGFSMTIMAVIVGLRKTFSAGDTFRLCSLSMFSVSFGTWMLGEQDLMEIFTTDTVRMAEMKYNALFLLPVFFIGFQFEESVDKRDKVKNSIFGIVWLIATGFSLFTYILHKTAGVNPRSFLLVSHVMDIGALLVVLVIRIKEIIRGRNRYKMSVYMTIVAAFAGGFELVRYIYLSKVTKNVESGFSTDALFIVFLFFVLSLFFDYMTNAIESAKQKERMAVMAKLAFTDSLTGLNNRQAAEQYYDKVDETGEPFIVAWFDLNDLKETNDTYGHNAGDKYIQLFADILRETFEGKGFIARAGGDEFVYVISKKDDDDIIKLFEQLGGLNERLAEIDTEFMDMKMNVSYGIYDSIENDAENIREALRIADARMYDMKKTMKVERG